MSVRHFLTLDSVNKTPLDAKYCQEATFPRQRRGEVPRLTSPASLRGLGVRRRPRRAVALPRRRRRDLTGCYIMVHRLMVRYI